MGMSCEPWRAEDERSALSVYWAWWAFLRPAEEALAMKTQFVIDIPPPESLTADELNNPDGYPIVLRYPSWPDACAHVAAMVAAGDPDALSAATPDALAARIVERLAALVGGPPAPQKAKPEPDDKADRPPPPAPLPDDAIVDQRSAPVPKDLFLRLARAKAFPSKKVGKRICARWSDVKVAFAVNTEKPDPAPRLEQPNALRADDDGLDDLRSEIGLAKKGR